MVQEITCECEERYECEINSHSFFLEIKQFFEDQVKVGTYKDVPVDKPYHVGYSMNEAMEWHASKWYICEVCGCLWEFEYPEFPARGFVRKFSDVTRYEQEH